MLNGFDKQTEPLTDYERNILLPVIAKGLSLRVGARRAVRNKEIVNAMQRAGYDLNEARLRKVINHIRCNGCVKCLVATSKGYYVATSPDEVVSYITSLGGREGAIRAVREALERQLDEWIEHINQNNHHHTV